MTYVLHNIGYCSESPYPISMYFTINMAFSAFSHMLIMSALQYNYSSFPHFQEQKCPISLSDYVSFGSDDFSDYPCPMHIYEKQKDTLHH